LRTAPDAATAVATLKTQGFEVDYVEDYNDVRLGAVRLEGVRLIDNVPLARGSSTLQHPSTREVSI
jgi:pantoate--beta-alanine ligase